MNVNHYDILKVLLDAEEKARANGTTSWSGAVEAMAEALAENFDITEANRPEPGDICELCTHEFYDAECSRFVNHYNSCPTRLYDPALAETMEEGTQ